MTMVKNYCSKHYSLNLNDNRIHKVLKKQTLANITLICRLTTKKIDVSYFSSQQICHVLVSVRHTGRCNSYQRKSHYWRRATLPCKDAITPITLHLQHPFANRLPPYPLLAASSTSHSQFILLPSASPSHQEKQKPFVKILQPNNSQASKKASTLKIAFILSRQRPAPE